MVRCAGWLIEMIDDVYPEYIEHRGTKARYTFNSSGVYYGLCTVLLYKAIGCDLRYPLDACGYHKLEDSTEEYPIRADHCTISVDLDIKTTFFYAGQPASVRSNSNRTLICRKEQCMYVRTAGRGEYE